MKTKDAMQISAQTLPNGYSLTVNGESFMYFNEIDWLAGVMAHVGLGDTSVMEKGTVLSTLFSAMIGDAYADSVTTLKQRVGMLTSQYNTTIDRMDKAIDYVSQAEKTISGFLNRLDTLEQMIKGTESEHAQSKKEVTEMKVRLNEIEKKSNKVAESLANSATIMKAIEEVGETVKKGKADEGHGKPDKSVGNDGKTDKPAEDTHRKCKGGRNKAADAKILKAIKDNPNII